MKRIGVLFSVISLLLLCTPVSFVSAETISGAAGESAAWTLDTQTGRMTISGTGKIDGNYQSEENGVCVADYKDLITEIVIEDGVTELGLKCFIGWKALKSVVVPGSVTIIGSAAFAECSLLERVTLSEGLIHIGPGAFRDCCSLRYIHLPNSLQYIWTCAFCYSGLEFVDIPQNVFHLGFAAFDRSLSVKGAIVRCKTINQMYEGAWMPGQPENLFPSTVSSIIFEDVNFPIEKTLYITASKTIPYYAPSGGTVEAYCAEKGIPFIPLESLVTGDIDGDNALSTVDVRQTLHTVLANTALDSRAFYCADVNGDRAVDTTDARLMLLQMLNN